MLLYVPSTEVSTAQPCFALVGLSPSLLNFGMATVVLAIPLPMSMQMMAETAQPV